MNESRANTSQPGERSLRPRWEWSADEIKRVGCRVVDLIAEHLTGLPERPVFRPFPPLMAEKYLDSKPPETGEEATISLPHLHATLNHILLETAIHGFSAG